MVWCLIVSDISFLIKSGYLIFVCFYNNGNILKGVKLGIVFILLIMNLFFDVKKKFVCIRSDLLIVLNVLIVSVDIFWCCFFVILVGIIRFVLLFLYLVL